MYNDQQKIQQFINLQKREDLAGLFNISIAKLYFLLYSDKKLYTSFSINKKNGGVREIVAPCKELKRVQRDLNQILNSVYSFNKGIVHGFLKENSIKTNADIHKNANFILNIDLKDFFGTIHFGRVRGMFMHEPFMFSNCIATNLAKICCFDKKLPQGAPTSPTIANIICYKMDRELKHFCEKYNCKYSRYADDLTISSNSLYFPEDIAFLVDSVSGKRVVVGDGLLKIITDQGFSINYDKLRLNTKMNRQEVTGLVVNKKVNVKKVYLKNLRAMLHKIGKYGFYLEGIRYFEKSKSLNFCNRHLVVSNYKNVVKGKIEFLKMIKGIDDLVYIKYATIYNNLVEKELFDVDYGKELAVFIENRTFPLFSFDYFSQGTCFMTNDYGFVTSTHVLFNRSSFFSEDKYRYLKKQSNFSLCEHNAKVFYLLDHYEHFFPIEAQVKKSNIETDVYFDKNIKVKKNFKVNADYVPKIGEEIYLAGYGGFKNYKDTSINIISAKITGTDVFDKRKIFCVSEKIYHGMSGGPVINQKREVIGVIYVGLNLHEEEGVMSKHNGFILFKDIISNL